MRQALRVVREQLGEDAVILSSRRTAEGVEVTAAVDFDASTLDSAPADLAAPSADPTPPASHRMALTPVVGEPPIADAPPLVEAAVAPVANPPTRTAATIFARRRAAAAQKLAAEGSEPRTATGSGSTQAVSSAGAQPGPNVSLRRRPGSDDAEWLSPAVREAVLEPQPTALIPTIHSERARPQAPVTQAPVKSAPLRSPPVRSPLLKDPLVKEVLVSSLSPFGAAEPAAARTVMHSTAVSGERSPDDWSPAALPGAASAAAPTDDPVTATDVMGSELKTLRRMLETQLAHLAWNDLTRRAPVHAEILRELTEIGITQDLAQHLVRQLPEDTDLTFARRFAIAGLSQYLRVTGDNWLDEGGCVAFCGATGVGKTTTLAKVAVRWVLRHGSRDLALVAADSVRIGAQDQLQSFGQLLGVPVYSPGRFEELPALLGSLRERLILVDTPGSSVRDAALAERLTVLAGASRVETAVVLSASTQVGALEETVEAFAPARPASCVLTKLDEAVSLGGILSILIQAKLPVSYLSEGQRVPEDLRPGRALELVSLAVRLAKASGAAADEDLLRRRFGKTAHGIN